MDELLHIPLRAPAAPYTARMTYFNTFPEVRHDHLFWEAVIVLSGSATQSVGETQREMRAGDILLLRPKEAHSFSIHDIRTYEHRDVYIPCRDLMEICHGLEETLYDALLERKEPLFSSLGEPLLHAVDARLAEFETPEPRSESPYRTAAFRAAVAGLIGILVRDNLTKDGRPDWLVRFLSEIKKPEKLCLPLSEISRFSGFSHSRLCVLFKQHTGVTLHSFLVEQRLELALRLLNSTDASVLDISARLGYDSMSHFIHIFKSRYGVTPDRYRRLYRSTDAG